MPLVSGFVQRSGDRMFVAGTPYRVAGSNTYYLAYVPAAIQDAAFDLAAGFGMNVIRCWAFFDCPAPPTGEDVCFQYFDPATTTIRIQDGPNGLERLDRAIAVAGERGIRLVLTLTNNWVQFGGMPQYVQWFGMDPKRDKNRFYTHDGCTAAYQAWLAQIVNRRNSITGRLYRDEPAILAWELANEPRCEVSGGVQVLTDWVQRMSAYLRGLDANHLIAVGDEGYFHHHFAFGNPLFNGSFGVSTEDLMNVGTVDFGSVHLYPELMAAGKNPAQFGQAWIEEHIDAAARANKPLLIGEYGLANAAERNAVFDSWLKLVEARDCWGDLLWMTGTPKGPGQPYQLDGYALGDPALAPAVREHASRMLPSQQSGAATGE